MHSILRQRRGALILLTLMALGALVAGCGRRGTDSGDPAASAEAPPAVELEPRTIPVFCYHAMSEGATGTYEVPSEDFAEQLAAIAEAGYQTVTPTQIADYLAGQDELPEKPVCLTFDDGPRSILTVSKPMMDEHGFVGTAFLITNSVGGTGKLTWDDVRELEAAGWEIGSHTQTHLYATRVRGEDYAAEAEQSRAAIEEHIEGECVSLAYPFGLYDEETLEITRDAGYRIAFTIDRGPADQSDEPYLIPREMVVNGNSLKTFRRWLSQEKLHIEQVDPPRGHRFDSRSAAISARLGDESLRVSDIEFTLAGNSIDVDVAEDGRSLTLHPQLATGANIIRANYWGSPERETSWVVVCDAE